jgi:hypothetical protein
VPLNTDGEFLLELELELDSAGLLGGALPKNELVAGSKRFTTGLFPLNEGLAYLSFWLFHGALGSNSTLSLVRPKGLAIELVEASKEATGLGIAVVGVVRILFLTLAKLIGVARATAVRNKVVKCISEKFILWALYQMSIS